MSCQGKSNTVGLAVDYAPGVVAVAHHGCADAAFDETMKRYAFETTEAVIAELADKSLPMPVRAVMLRNLAMNGVPTERIADSLLDGEAYQYERYQGAQKILAWANLSPKTDPRDVKRIRLRHKGIEELVAGIGEFGNLEVLVLQGNELKTVPPEVGELRKLKRLDLGSNRIETLPPELWQLERLTELILADNKLDSLPPDVVKLQKLERLILSDNELEALPPEIGELVNLKTLWAWDNQLRSIPPEIGQLGQLDSLYLSRNQLVELPAELGDLWNLTTLSLSQNGIVAVPAELEQLEKLKLLSLEHNPITRLPMPDVLAKLRESGVKVGLEMPPKAVLPESSPPPTPRQEAALKYALERLAHRRKMQDENKAEVAPDVWVERPTRNSFPIWDSLYRNIRGDGRNGEATIRPLYRHHAGYQELARRWAKGDHWTTPDELIELGIPQDEGLTQDQADRQEDIAEDRRALFVDKELNALVAELPRLAPDVARARLEDYVEAGQVWERPDGECFVVHELEFWEGEWAVRFEGNNGAASLARLIEVAKIVGVSAPPI
jgi:hypothetical protein